MVIFVLATTLHLVTGNNYNNCNRGSDCSSRKNSLTRHLLSKERHQRAQSKIHLNSTKYQSDKLRGYKRDGTFAEVLMNLLSKVDNAKRKVVELNSPPRALTKPPTSLAKKPTSNAVNASKTTPAPITSVAPSVTASPTASSTTGGPTTGTPVSEATTASGATDTTSPSPTPTITVTPSPNVSCNASLGPCTTSKPPVKPDRYNITIAPGVVLTPNGQIILNPQFPLLIGGSQTSGAKPIPGISLGAAELPGIVSVSSGTVASGHGAVGQQGRSIENNFYSSDDPKVCS